MASGTLHYIYLADAIIQGDVQLVHTNGHWNNYRTQARYDTILIKYHDRRTKKL
uniref:Uncharacterized protein n=1 Tax=Anguilla anguilla TaxID=7936 RepID=A0A0E9S1E4_ANGAN